MQFFVELVGGCAFVSEIWRKKQLNWNIMSRAMQIKNNCQHSLRLNPFKENQELKSQAYVFCNSHIGSFIQRSGFCSFASSQTNENESVLSGNETNNAPQKELPDKKVSVKRRRRRGIVKRSKFSDDSDSDSESLDLSRDGLIKLLGNKEKLLKKKQLEMEIMKDKALRVFAENNDVIERTKRQTESSKIFAIQSFAKSLLDVADNLSRASSVVKDRFTKIETTEDPSGALPLLKTLLEGVEMTEKQLAEVFKKFGLERYDSVNEQFDPNRHNAVFQVPDQSKPPNTVAVVIKPGYALHERIIRPAEVGVVVGVAADNKETD